MAQLSHHTSWQYKLKGNMEGVKYDPEHAVDSDKSLWVD